MRGRWAPPPMERGSKGRAVNGNRLIGAGSCRWEQHTKGDMPTPPPPPWLSVGPNFSHHKARVQAVGWFPLGTRKQGSRPFAAPTPPNRNGAGPKAGPAPPPPPHALAPSHSLQAVTWGSRSLPTWTGSRRRTTSMLGSGTRMVTQQVVLLSQTSEQVDPTTTTPPPPACAPDGRGARSRRPQGPKSGGCAGLTA